MKWFKEKFLPSFGKCENKRISKKQYDIFRKYLWKNEAKEISDFASGTYTMEVEFCGKSYFLCEKSGLWQDNEYTITIS